jgi:hypothetical protein
MTEETPEQCEERWIKDILKHLKGKKIVDARYMDYDEAQGSGFRRRPIILIFNDGTAIYPMMDDEGNDAGAIGTNIRTLQTIPVFR